MTRLDRLLRAYRDKGFHVVAIAQDDTKTVQKIKPLVTSKKFLLTVIADSNKEIGNRYNVRQHPTCFLIAKDGTVVHHAQGYIPGDEDQLEGLVRSLLDLEPLPAGSESPK
jgi:thioredoxin-related protein